MITKREVLKVFEKDAMCTGVNCTDCPFRDIEHGCSLHVDLVRLGAKEMLKTLPREFDKSRVLTCVTADQTKPGIKGWFADDLEELKTNFYNNELYELLKVREENCAYRFENKCNEYALFYPIDEVEE